MGKEAARFEENKSSEIYNPQNAPLPSPNYPLESVILNELVLSLQSTSEMKDLLLITLYKT
jgi:hypothetical protein